MFPLLSLLVLTSDLVCVWTRGDEAQHQAGPPAPRPWMEMAVSIPRTFQDVTVAPRAVLGFPWSLSGDSRCHTLSAVLLTCPAA